MTLQELAALPVGAKLRQVLPGLSEYGTIVVAGKQAQIAWESGSTTLLDTQSVVWAHFVADLVAGLEVA
jgi:hypothetical protein